MSRAAKGTVSAAGIVESATSNERVIPQSRRADGSVRKERRVKPGFVPAEDVQRFVPSRVRQARAAEEGRSEGVVGLSSTAKDKDRAGHNPAAERGNRSSSASKPLPVGAADTFSGDSDAVKSWRKKPEEASKEKAIKKEVPEAWDDEDETSKPEEKQPSVEDVVDQIASLNLRNAKER